MRKPDPISLPDALLVTEDRPCSRCGYNLRTLPRRGNCPECNWPVAASLAVISFRDASEKWLMVVALGLVLLVLSSVLAIGSFAQLPSLSNFGPRMPFMIGPGGPRIWLLLRLLMLGWVRFLEVASLASFVLGVIAITWPDDRPKGLITTLASWLLCAMALVALAVGVTVVARAEGVIWLINIRRQIPLHWWIIFDAAALILTSFAIGRIAARGGFIRVAICIGCLTVVQSIGFEWIAIVATSSPNRVSLIFSSAALYGLSGAALICICLWLMTQLLSEAQRRRNLRSHLHLDSSPLH